MLFRRPVRPARRAVKIGAVALVLLASACSGGATVVADAPSVSVTTPTSAAVVATSTTSRATTSTASSTTVATTTTTPDLTWNLLAGGDVLMDRSEPAGIDPFAGISPHLSTADVAVVNVEMAISDRGTPVPKQFVFRAPPSAADRIAAGGVDIASLGNNHARDFGGDALVDSVDLLAAAGVLAVGAGATDADAYRHGVFELDNGLRLGVVGTSMIVPGGFTAGPSSPGIAAATQRDRVLANVSVASRDTDVVIALVHWGIERDTCPSGAQRAFARDLLAAGATAVIGHHPHVLQPVEFADGRLVAYSLGNFIWHPRSGITGDTGVLELRFDGPRIESWEFHPHLLDTRGAPVPVAEGSRFDRITDIVSGACERHDPPPLPPPTTSAPTTAPPGTVAPSTTAPLTTTPAEDTAPATSEMVTTAPSTTAPAPATSGG